jgi:hypothetical protein
MSYGLETVPESILMRIMLNLSIHDVIQLIQTSHRMKEFCQRWDVWTIKARYDLGIGSDVFHDTSFKNPVERYWQIGNTMQAQLKKNRMIQSIPSTPLPLTVSRPKSLAQEFEELFPVLTRYNKLWSTLPPESMDPSYRLYVAAQQGDLDAVIAWHLQGAGETVPAVTVAAQAGHFEIVRYIVEHIGTWETREPLIAAARHGHLEIVQYVMDHGGWCIDEALREAAAYGHRNVVQYLLDHGAIFISSAIQAAEANQQWQMVEYLRTRQSQRR